MYSRSQYHGERSRPLLWALLATLGLGYGCGGGGGGFLYKATPPDSADATKQPLDDPARQTLLAKIETEESAACRDQGFYFDRRRGECFEDLKINKFPCTRQGIIEAFYATGMQIEEILDRSLGDPTKPDDKGEGFVIDQCSRSASGRILVNLMKEGQDGKIQVRELESKR